MLNRLILIVALVSPAASAADWYAEVAYGEGDYLDVGYVDTPSTYAIGGGVRFNDYFGAQLDWSYRDAPVVPVPCPGLCVSYYTPRHGLALRALGRLPLGKHFELNGGIGLVRLTYSPANLDETVDLLSFGVGWRIDERWTLGVQREVESGFTNIPDITFDAMTLRFGF
jgi:opacity protein-like surface antigen